MFKASKRDTSLCERDSLRDMLAHERELLRLYAAAAAQDLSLSDRSAVVELFTLTSDDACTVLAELRASGEEEILVAEERCHRTAMRYEKEKKSIPTE